MRSLSGGSSHKDDTEDRTKDTQEALGDGSVPAQGELL
jgi:hypothetical protein